MNNIEKGASNLEETNDLKKEFGTFNKSSAKKFGKNNSADHGYENLKYTADQISDDIEGFFSNEKENIIKIKDKCVGAVKAHPLSYLFGAVAVGTLVGILIKR